MEVGAARGWPRRRLLLRRAWHGFLRHRGYDSAAALTFFSSLAALPGALLVVSAFAFLDDRDRAVRDITALLGTLLPDDAAESAGDVVRDLLSLDSPLLGLIIAAVLTLWSVSGYATAFGRAVNTVYDTQEGRPIWLFRGQALLLAVLLAVLWGGIAACLLLAPTASDSIFGGGDSGPGPAIWSVARWVLALALLAGLIAALYGLAPNVRFPSRRWLSIGTAIALGAWLVATAAFAGYVALIGAYGQLYGRAGIILVALLWSYLSNLALMIGAEVDAELVRMHQLEQGIDATETIRMPVKHMARMRMMAGWRNDDLAGSRAVRDHPEHAHRAD